MIVEVAGVSDGVSKYYVVRVLVSDKRVREGD
jgi:hypothetical protein